MPSLWYKEIQWLVNALADGGPSAFFWKMLIQPRRRTYTVEELGNSHFILYEESHERIDLQIENADGCLLECSHFRPVRNRRDRLPCVVYVHGHSSSRLDAAPLLTWLLPLRVSVFSFDCAGSGQSEGEYSSVGYNEEKDLCAVLTYLRRNINVSAIAIWGRSSGAVASIRCAAEDHDICAMILDSPFSDLLEQIREIVDGGLLPVPGFLVDPALKDLRAEVFARAKFDIEEHKPVEKAPLATTPAMFATSQDDKVVLPHHVERLYEAWGCPDKHYIFLDGSHNSPRPTWFMEEASKFLCEHFSLALYGGVDGRIQFGPQVASPYWEGDQPDDAELNLPPPSTKVKGMLLQDPLVRLEPIGCVDDADAAEWELDLSSCSRDDGVAIDFDDLCDAELVVPIAPLKLPQEEEEQEDETTEDADDGLSVQEAEMGTSIPPTSKPTPEAQPCALAFYRVFI